MFAHRNSNQSSTNSLLPGVGHNSETGVRSAHSSLAGVSEKYSLSPSPATWGTPVYITTPEDDDYLHNPDPVRDRINDRGGSIFNCRAFTNLGCLFLLVVGILMLFAGYPILSETLRTKPTTQGGFNLGGINATGQVPDIPGNYGLIDKETPISAYTKTAYTSGEEMVLVFSDEFNTEGRTFYPGDDPYWEAVDLHYWGTNDLEWYDPKQATTRNGHLEIVIDRVDPESNHNLSYVSAMLQTWNKFCFTGGIMEASVRLPGSSNISGLWPGFWTMGNLGRAGYGSSVEGLWPYSYDSCDVGTFPNQTYPGTSLPAAALTDGDRTYGGVLSYLPGQRLSACTCPGESHPGPQRADGSYVGRAAPEIDAIEATVEDGVGKVSLSAQWAPYNAGYRWLNTSDNVVWYDEEVTQLNGYAGGIWQQCTSGLAITNQTCYELNDGCFTTYGFEYKPGYDEGYITWVNNGLPAWTLRGPGMGPDPATEISERIISREPMYIITNLGFSHNFAVLQLDSLTFPATMAIDWIRVYQPKDAINYGCDPIDYPTATYIEAYKEAYSNPNRTLWEQISTWPKNRLLDGCD